MRLTWPPTARTGTPRFRCWDPTGCIPDFTVRLLTLAVVATITGQPYPAGCAALAADPALAAHAVAQVVALADTTSSSPAVVLAASLVRTAAEEESGPSAGSVDHLLAQAAQQIAATRDFTDQEIDDAAELMAKMSGVEPDGSSLRRNRKLVSQAAGAPRGGAAVTGGPDSGESLMPIYVVGVPNQRVRIPESGAGGVDHWFGCGCRTGPTCRCGAAGRPPNCASRGAAARSSAR